MILKVWKKDNFKNVDIAVLNVDIAVLIN